MKRLIAALIFCSALPLSAQTARVRVIASLTIPNLMMVTPGTVSAATSQGDELVQRVTVHVSSNRGWALMVTPPCVSSSCDGVTWRIIPAGAARGFELMTSAPVATGKPGTSVPVTIEFRWRKSDSAPDLGNLRYSLSLN